MKKPERDLLVMFKQGLMNPRALELEVSRLHELLHRFEHPSTILISYEVIDLNQYKISNHPGRIKRYMRTREWKPFVFFVNRN